MSTEQKALPVVAWAVPDGDGGINFGKGWGFSPMQFCDATTALTPHTEVQAEIDRLTEARDEARSTLREACARFEEALSAAHAERDAALVDARRLREAAQGVLSHMVGRQPIEGYLRDNEASRDALAVLLAATVETRA